MALLSMILSLEYEQTLEMFVLLLAGLLTRSMYLHKELIESLRTTRIVSKPSGLMARTLIHEESAKVE